MTSSAFDSIAQLGPTTDIPTAARMLGFGRTLAYELAQRGQFPCRVLRVGRRYIAPTADLLALLGVPAIATVSGDATAQPVA
jgi:hypothetical protein